MYVILPLVGSFKALIFDLVLPDVPDDSQDDVLELREEMR